MSLLIILYSDCPDAVTAGKHAGALLDALARLLPHCDVSLREPPTRYWKIPQYFGFDLELAQAGPAELHRLIDSCPGNWWICADDTNPEAVWNAGEGPALLIAEARWVQLIVPHED